MAKSLDVGTANLVMARLSKKTKTTKVKSTRNAFFQIPNDNFSKQMLKKLKLPFVTHDKNTYVLGDHAFELARIFNKNARRPMSSGVISSSDIDAIPMINLIISELLGKPKKDNEICVYSIPANPIDAEMDAVFHKTIFEDILRRLGYDARELLEAHAIVFEELEKDEFTGIAISCGAGMWNICVAYRSVPAISFSTTRGGDWVDSKASKATGVVESRITTIKEKGVDLTKPKGREESAIAAYYKNMITYTLANIRDKFLSSTGMPDFSNPVDIVCAGGTSMIGGFEEIFREVFEDFDFPIKIKNIRVADEPLYSVAKGLLVYAITEEEDNE